MVDDNSTNYLFQDGTEENIPEQKIVDDSENLKLLKLELQKVRRNYEAEVRRCETLSAQLLEQASCDTSTSSIRKSHKNLIVNNKELDVSDRNYKNQVTSLTILLKEIQHSYDEEVQHRRELNEQLSSSSSLLHEQKKRFLVLSDDHEHLQAELRELKQAHNLMLQRCEALEGQVGNPSWRFNPNLEFETLSADYNRLKNKLKMAQDDYNIEKQNRLQLSRQFAEVNEKDAEVKLLQQELSKTKTDLELSNNNYQRRISSLTDILQELQSSYDDEVKRRKDLDMQVVMLTPLATGDKDRNHQQEVHNLQLMLREAQDKYNEEVHHQQEVHNLQLIIKKLENRLLFKAKEEEQSEDQITSLKRSLQDLQDRYDAELKRNEGLSMQIAQSPSRSVHGMRGADDLSHEVERLKAMLQQSQQDYDLEVQRRQSLNSELVAAQLNGDKVKRLEMQLSAKTEEAEESEGHITSLKRSLQDLQDKYDTELKRNEGSRSVHGMRGADDLSHEVERLKAMLQQSQQDYDLEVQRRQSLNSELVAAQLNGDKVKRLEMQLAAKTEEAEESEGRITSLKRSLQDLQDKFDTELKRNEGSRSVHGMRGADDLSHEVERLKAMLQQSQQDYDLEVQRRQSLNSELVAAQLNGDKVKRLEMQLAAKTEEAEESEGHITSLKRSLQDLQDKYDTELKRNEGSRSVHGMRGADDLSHEVERLKAMLQQSQQDYDLEVQRRQSLNSELVVAQLNGDKVKRLEMQLAAKTEEAEQSEGHITSLKRSLQDLQDKFDTELKRNEGSRSVHGMCGADDLSHEVERLKAMLQQSQQDYDLEVQRRQSLNSELVAAQLNGDKVKRLEMQLAAKTEEAEQSEGHITSLKRSLQDLQDKYDTELKRNEGSRSVHGMRGADDLSHEVERLKAMLQQSQQDYDLEVQRRQSLNSELVAAQLNGDKVKRLEMQLSAKTEEAEESEGRITSLKRSLQDLQDKYDTELKRNEGSRSVHGMRGADDLSHEVERLKAMLQQSQQDYDLEVQRRQSLNSELVAAQLNGDKVKRLEMQLAAKTEEAEQSEGRITSLKRSLQDLQDKYDTELKRNEGLSMQIAQSPSRSAHGMRGADDLSHEVERLKAMLQQSQQDYDLEVQRRQSLNSKLVAAQLNGDKVKRLEMQLAAKTEEAEESEGRITSLKRSLQDLQDKYDTELKRNEGLSMQIAQSPSRSAHGMRGADDLSHEVERLKAMLQQSQQDYDLEVQRRQSLNSELVAAQLNGDKVKRLEMQLSAKTEEAEESEGRITSLKRSLQDLQDKFDTELKRNEGSRSVHGMRGADDLSHEVERLKAMLQQSQQDYDLEVQRRQSLNSELVAAQLNGDKVKRLEMQLAAKSEEAEESEGRITSLKRSLQDIVEKCESYYRQKLGLSVAKSLSDDITLKSSTSVEDVLLQLESLFIKLKHDYDEEVQRSRALSTQLAIKQEVDDRVESLETKLQTSTEELEKSQGSVISLTRRLQELQNGHDMEVLRKELPSVQKNCNYDKSGVYPDAAILLTENENLQAKVQHLQQNYDLEVQRSHALSAELAANASKSHHLEKMVYTQEQLYSSGKSNADNVASLTQSLHALQEKHFVEVEQIDKLKVELTLTSDKVRNLNTENTKLRDEAEALKTEIRSLQHTSSSEQSENRKLLAKLRELENIFGEKKQKEGEEENFSPTTIHSLQQALQECKDKNEMKLLALTKELEDLQVAHDAVSAEYESIKAKMKDTTYTELKSKYDEEVARGEYLAQQLLDECEKSASRSEDAMSTIAMLKEKNDILEKSTTESKSAMSALKSRCVALERQVNSTPSSLLVANAELRVMEAKMIEFEKVCQQKISEEKMNAASRLR